MEFGLIDIFTILLVTIGPLKAAIIFGMLTSNADTAFRKKVATKAVTVAFIVSMVFAIFGEFILQIFHVSLPALKIAGGIILMLFALEMVMGHEEKSEASSTRQLSESIAIYPIAMPMMATPQGIVAIVTLVAATETVGRFIGILIMIVLIMGINLGVLLSADRLIKRLGPSVLQIIGRIAGILLAALAVQLMIIALRDLGVLAPLESVGH